MHCFDGLTGAVNRRTISLLLEQTFENHKRYNDNYALAMLDVDLFKSINDNHGHLSGDYILKNVAICMREHLRKSDCVGRYGGEEFLIIFPKTRAEDVHTIMDKIRSGIENTSFVVNDTEIRVTVSAGIASPDTDDTDAWQAVDRADKALYEAKAAGRNRENR